MKNRAEEFFQTIVAAASPTTVIGELIRDEQPETEFLEFKGGSLNPKDAKRYWSKALSGFANTEGGVLIWGVDARKTQSADDSSVQVDVACGTNFVEKPAKFAEHLRRSLLEAVVDPVAGVDIRAYEADKNGGFVVCLIPEGLHKPHRAAIDETRNYFHRVGDSFAVISHSLLRSLFHPHFAPSLSVTIDFNPRASANGAAIRGCLALHNTGTATARNVKAWISAPLREWAIDRAGNRIKELEVSRSPGANYRLLEPETDLHPGQTISLCILTWEGPARTVGTCRQTELDRSDFPVVAFCIRVFCSDHPEQVINAEFTANEVNDRASKKFFPAEV